VLIPLRSTRALTWATHTGLFAAARLGFNEQLLRFAEEALRLCSLRPARVFQPQLCLMDQRGCLERSARFFMSHLVDGEPPQFLVQERQQLLGGTQLAAVTAAQDASDFAHEVQHNHRKNNGQIRPGKSSERTSAPPTDCGHCPPVY
jgi:hypothetical protein